MKEQRTTYIQTAIEISLFDEVQQERAAHLETRKKLEKQNAKLAEALQKDKQIKALVEERDNYKKLANLRTFQRDMVFDGYAVYEKMEEIGSAHTVSSNDVSNVLDALWKLMGDAQHDSV